MRSPVITSEMNALHEKLIAFLGEVRQARDRVEDEAECKDLYVNEITNIEVAITDVEYRFDKFLTIYKNGS